MDFEVENALLRRALGYTITLSKQKVTKDGDVIDYEEEVHYPPDVTAQIFWLSNRKRKDWKRDPANVEIRKKELELKQKIAEENNW